MSKVLWVGRRNICGRELSFEFYKITSDKLYIKTGLLSVDEEEVYLYKVKDKKFTQGPLQKLFKTGTIALTVTDGEAYRIELKNIREPVKVKKLLDKLIDESKTQYGLHGSEMFGSSIVNNR